MRRRRQFALPAALLLGATLAASACDSSSRMPSAGAASVTDSTAGRAIAAVASAPAAPSATGLVPNELGRIPVLEYHLLGDPESTWKVSTARFRENLELLYARGYRPVNVRDIVDRKLDLPAGLSPVVLVFDDASPSQFSYVERDGKLEVDPESAVGMLLAFNEKHPDWNRKGVFCMLPAAQSGHAFFGDKGIKDQKSAWRYTKVRFLNDQGFELCNHTLYHANLGKQTDAVAQEFIARGDLAIDSAVQGFKVRTFALPLGVWPKTRPLAWSGAWTDAKSGKTVKYDYDAVLEVAGGPTRSPHDSAFDPRRMTRVVVFGRELEKTLDQLDRGGNRYVSDGDPSRVAKPMVVADKRPVRQAAVAARTTAPRARAAERAADAATRERAATATARRTTRR